MTNATHKRMLDQSDQQLNPLEGSKAYRELRQTVTKAGVLDRQYLYYTILMLFVFVGFFYSIYMLLLSQNIFITILWAFFVGFFSVQVSGLLHDAGHRAMFKSNFMNDIFGNIFGAILAMGYNQWKWKHNQHHAHTNQEDEDPDVDLPLLCFTPERWQGKSDLSKKISKYQAFFYYPFGSLVVFSVRIANIRYIFSRRGPKTWIQSFVYALGIAFWFIVPFMVFDFSKAIVALLVVNATAGFYLLNVFAPNHKGMPQIKKGVKLSFFEQQVITSRNIYGNWFTDFIYMGLNYQIEHHLFPNCPRNKLPAARIYTMEICKKMGLEYTEVGIIETNKIIVSELHQIALSG